MLDDDAGRPLEGLHAFPCSIGVGDIVVRQLLALELTVVRRARRGTRVEIAIERSVLMRILAVAQILHFAEVEIEPFGKRAARPVLVERGEIVADRAVVCGGVRERFAREVEARASR